ncbi:hypothetical protein GTP58_30345 [Duganella sp. CY15W]|uniref:hypothetical protein n=1 Tax=Duganella sp. CY15W TaxID=2692172 RepID=UPI00136AA4AA|nr:hypothetical protein [Duganella sp. CY15W]MYM32641.1 hypothetical protein [Duganella sp. CY15W]
MLRAETAGGGWNLKLHDAEGNEVGSGVFPLIVNEGAEVAWWKSLKEEERHRWMRRAESAPTVTGAYLAYLSDESYLDAQMAGDE